MVQMDAPPTIHDASGDILPILMEASVEIKMGQGPICIWVFTANITDEFILEHHAHPRCICEFQAPCATNG
jgi:hypothetical protein